MYRVDEILTAIHHDRHMHRDHMFEGKFKNICLLPSSFAKRLIAANIPMTPEGIQNEVLRRLQVDQDRMLEVAEGKKHVLETVCVSTLEQHYEDVNKRAIELMKAKRAKQQALELLELERMTSNDYNSLLVSKNDK